MADPAPQPPTLDDYVVAYHRRDAGNPYRAECGDFATAATADPTLLAAAQAELAQLAGENDSANRTLFDRCYVTRSRYAALQQMISDATTKVNNGH